MDPEIEDLVMGKSNDSREMSLTTNMAKSTMEERRLKWNYTPSYPDTPKDDLIHLKKLEIITMQMTKL